MLKYKGYTLIYPNKDQISRIHEVIDRENGSIFHDFSLNKIVQETFNTDLFYLVDDTKNLNSLAPIHVVKNRFGIKRYHFKPLFDIPYAGFIGNKKLNEMNLSLGFFESVKYEGFPDFKKYTSFKSNYRETSMVDLSDSEETIFENSIHSKRRNMIRKALKSDIIVKIYHDSEGLDLFWPILDSLHKNLNLNYLSLDYYQRILNTYKDNKQAFTILAFKDGKVISGVFIIGNKNYMHYYKGASLPGVKNEGQGELLQWEAIKYSKALGSKFYDLCNLDKEKLPTIYRFKTGISANIYYYPVFTKNKLGYKIIKRFLINDKS